VCDLFLFDPFVYRCCSKGSGLAHYSRLEVNPSASIYIAVVSVSGGVIFLSRLSVYVLFEGLRVNPLFTLDIHRQFIYEEHTSTHAQGTDPRVDLGAYEEPLSI